MGNILLPYTVMPFGLKNAGATYQQAATTLLHDMMHKEVEVYVDDMIVKSKDRAGHDPTLRKFFDRLWKYNMRLNPKKCAFGVTSDKLLGYVISTRGIEIDPSKIKAIMSLKPPSNEKEIRGFLGRLQYVSRDLQANYGMRTNFQETHKRLTQKLGRELSKSLQ